MRAAPSHHGAAPSGPFERHLAVTHTRSGSISFVPTLESETRGRQVAQRLGWPAEDQGLLGALGSLVDPKAFRYQRLIPAQAIVDAYNRQSEAAVHARLLRTVRQRLQDKQRI